MPPLITLLTDFGTQDTYVGQMKGVIATLCPTAAVIDLTHAVRPQQVEQGAFLLETAVEYMPSGAIHLAVVDPGVGTARRALAIRDLTGDQVRYFVGPDNGLLSCALPPDARPDTVATVRLPSGCDAVALEGDAGRKVSPTFHGRDIFAVAAARLASGVPIEELGPGIADMIALPPFLARHTHDGTLAGRVVHIDRFGNLITTVHASQLPSQPGAIRISGHTIGPVVRTYGESSGLVALVGSGGYLEVSEVNGDAAARLGARLGTEVFVDLGSG